VRPYAILVLVGLALVGVVSWIGGRPAAFGGGVGLVAQLAAVALLRPAMGAPQSLFLARWLSGMGIRALALGIVVIAVLTRRGTLPPLPTLSGFLGVLVPLLLVETKFLK